MTGWVDQVFGHDGLLSKRFPDYELREGQVRMARATERAIHSGRHLMVEGPTGTGKSVAYLVPAIRHALDTGRAVVVATPLISLQEQLVDKDLPMLREVLPDAFSFGLLKGRGNFLCPQRYEEWLAERDTLWRNDEDEELVEWADSTETGDKSELPDGVPDALWSKVCGTPSCGSSCRNRGCFYQQRREEVAECDVVVCNYHILMAHLLFREETGVHAVLPPFNVAILDEAHRLAEVSRQFFSREASSYSVARQASRLQSFDRRTANNLARAGKEFFSAAKRGVARVRGGHVTTPWINGEAGTEGADLEAALARAQGAWDLRAKSLEANAEAEALEAKALLDDPVPEGLTEQLAMARAYPDPDERRRMVTEVKEKIKEEKEKATKRAEALKKSAKGRALRARAALRSADKMGELADTVKSACTMAGDQWTGSPWAYRVETKERRSGESVSLSGQPVDVSAYLSRALFDQTKCAVLTSATLAAGGSFGFVQDQTGFEGTTLQVQSPFDHTEQALLVLPLPEEIPVEPRSPKYAGHVAAVVEKVIEQARGRTLGLFTSYRVMRTVRDHLSGSKYRILCQGDAPRSRLVREFRKDVNSVLLGVASFWSGIDVKGESLSCVVVDKLPFPGPDDPVAAYLEREGGFRRAFREYSLPKALVELRQGTGRLIRSRTDRGVVVICDPRIQDRNGRHSRYGAEVRASLPYESFAWGVNSVGQFLGKRFCETG